jgi:uncharacterized protein
MQFSRRRLLKGTLASAAACGFGRLTIAHDAPSANPIIDTHVYLSHWPHNRLSSDEPTELIAALRRNNVSQAWVSSFDGLFHKDIGGVNQRLAETCSRLGHEKLIPFGTINPTLPDWEDDIRRCHESFHMPGVRLHPNYHSYTLDDPRFARLLTLATAGGLIVQLVARMKNERYFLLNPHTEQVDLKALSPIIAALQGARLLLTNAYRSAGDESIRPFLQQRQVHFDFARAKDSAEVGRLVEKTSPDRVVFGSGMPLHDVASISSLLQESQLAANNKQSIAVENARKLVALARSSSAMKSNNASANPVSTQ